MSEQSGTTTNPSSDPVLCKMGCGFFGSNATGDCCSKCWRSLNKDEPTAMTEASPATPPATPMETCAPAEAKPAAMEVEQAAAVREPAEAEPKAVEPVQTTPKKKKKKKKATYKDMMSGMLQGTDGGSPRDIAKEKEQLRKVTGGGVFSKIDKI